MHYLAIFFMLFQARAETSSIPLNVEVNVKESIVQIKGSPYRKIEYRGDIFYMRLLESEKDEAALEMECNSSGHLHSENQVLISVSMTKRSSLFVDGLKKVCGEMQAGRRKVAVDPNIRIGFMLPNSKKDFLKNKKVFIFPHTGGQLGFSADW